MVMKMSGEGGVFTLPVVDAFVTPQVAMRKMIEANHSAVVVRSGSTLLVLEAAALVDALAAKSTRTDLPIEAFSGVVMRRTRFAGTVDSGFVGLIEVGDGRFKASHDYLAARYLSAPRIAHCTNDDPHFYPPYVRDPGDPNRCVICMQPILLAG